MIALKNLAISRSRLAAVVERAEVKKQAREAGASNGSTRTRGAGVISQAILNTTKARYPDCKCEELVGLRAGMTIEEAQPLGAGCCDSRLQHWKGWVCPRLDTIRRAYA